MWAGGDLEDSGCEMTYTVVWRLSAQRTLAEIWTNTDDRQGVTQAADAIDALLRTGPVDVGESRGGNTRILTVLPLSVYYDVREEDRMIAVWAVWHVRRR